MNSFLPRRFGGEMDIAILAKRPLGLAGSLVAVVTVYALSSPLPYALCHESTPDPCGNVIVGVPG